jgi:multiple sugar transport system permease protein
MVKAQYHKIGKLNTSVKAWLFILPSLVIISSVIVYPLLRSVLMSFTDRILTYFHYSYIGLTNYLDVSRDSLFWQSLGNSLQLTFWNVTGSVLIGLGLALLLNSRVKGRNWFRAFLFLPWAVPSIVIALMFRWFYNDIYGFANHILVEYGLISQAINPLARPEMVWPAIMVPIVWNYYPFVMLVFLSVLQSVDTHLYEAAAIDGASRWRTFLHITLPALRPAMVLVVILQALWSFSEFALVYLLTGGGPANATMTLSIYIYKQGFGAKQLGYAAAMGTVMFFLLAGFTILYFGVIRRTRTEI